jgi:DNA-directed RNA polymerase subunit RPC12/RpoP
VLQYLRFSHRDGKHRYNWYKCGPCGKEFVKRQRSDYPGISCGCVPSRLRHGHERNRTKSPESTCYHRMRHRCLNPKSKDYPNYGGRGITVCARWLEKFENFLEDMGTKPGRHYSIERLDVNKGYEPGNCAWATKHQQSRNTRTNMYVLFKGERRIITDWLRHLSVSRTVYYRYKKRYRLSHKRALWELSTQYG